MDIVYGVGGLILGVGTMVLYTLVIGKGAKTKAAEILSEAERSAKDKLKDAEIGIKEKTLKLEATAERELGKSREKIHQRERDLDRRQSGIDQQYADLKKQEQFIESTQNRIKVKLAQVTQTEKDLNETLVRQRDELRKMTGLSKEEATSRLLLSLIHI